MGRPIPETTTETNSNEVKQPKEYRKRLQEKKEEGIVVQSSFQAKADYVCKRLGTPQNMQTSVLRMCKKYPGSAIDSALAYAVDATVANKTMLFFKRLHSLTPA